MVLLTRGPDASLSSLPEAEYKAVSVDINFDEVFHISQMKKE